MNQVKILIDFKVEKISRNQIYFSKDCLADFNTICKEKIERSGMDIDISKIINLDKCIIIDICENSIIVDTDKDESLFRGYVAAPTIAPSKVREENNITYIDEIAAIISFNLIPRRNSLFL